MVPDQLRMIVGSEAVPPIVSVLKHLKEPLQAIQTAMSLDTGVTVAKRKGYLMLQGPGPLPHTNPVPGAEHHQSPTYKVLQQKGPWLSSLYGVSKPQENRCHVRKGIWVQNFKKDDVQ